MSSQVFSAAARNCKPSACVTLKMVPKLGLPSPDMLREKKADVASCMCAEMKKGLQAEACNPFIFLRILWGG